MTRGHKNLPIKNWKFVMLAAQLLACQPDGLQGLMSHDSMGPKLHSLRLAGTRTALWLETACLTYPSLGAVLMRGCSLWHRRSATAATN